LLETRPFHTYQQLIPGDLDFDLWPTFIIFLMNFNSLSTLWLRAFIFDMCIAWDKTFSHIPTVLTWRPWLWPLIYFYKKIKNFNFLSTLWLRALIFDIWIAGDNTFPQTYQQFWADDLDFGLWPTFMKKIKNCNPLSTLGHRAFIFDICLRLDLFKRTNSFDLMTLTLTVDILFFFKEFQFSFYALT